MKSRNKKTGQIGNLILNINPNRESFSVLSTENGDTICGNLVIADYNSLAELNEEWEDYEEPKGYWFIDSLGEVYKHTKDSQALDIEQTAVEDWHLDIGNYFSSRAEAEKAVKRLHAWKRLKDKGFEFEGFGDRDRGYINEITIYAKLDNSGDYTKDLDLLFGGEE